MKINKNRAIGALAAWGLSNLIAYHLCVRRYEKRINRLIDISVAFSTVMTEEQLDTALLIAPIDPDFVDRLNSQ